MLWLFTLYSTACSWSSPPPQPVSSPPKETVKEPDIQKIKEWVQSSFRQFITLDTVYQQERRAQLIPLLKHQQGKRIASFRTSLYGHNGQPRVHNIELAAKMINHTLLLPGDDFSFNNLTGDSNNPQAGWQEAPQIVNKKLVPGYGGGICQVSTTIYNAVNQAHVDILERHRHSLPVGYVEAGRDATVSYPDLNLRFQNTRENPIRIDVLIQGGDVVCNVYELTTPESLTTMTH